MELNLITILSMLIFGAVISEAISGKQKVFARVGLGVLFFNMVFFNMGFYGESVSTAVVYVGLAILLIMVSIRAYHYMNLRMSK